MKVKLCRCRRARVSILSFVMIIAVLPILLTALASVNLQPDDTLSPPSWPHPFSLENYFQVHDQQTFFWQELVTSIAISALVTLITAAVSLLAAYALARSFFRGRDLLIHSFLILASLPAI